MTPGARLQAAIDILDEVVTAAHGGGAAADTLVARYFSTRRYAGSKDRRAVRELVYAAIRRAGERPVSGRAAMLGLVQDRPELADDFDGSPHGPQPIDGNEPVAAAGVAPAWLIERLHETLDASELPALLERAPLDARVNRLKTTREDVLAQLTGAEPTPHAPDGIRLPEGMQVASLDLGGDGLIEVQDEGSQIVAAACGAAPEMLVVDLCAGAGGKTLAIAAAMANKGRIVACDSDRGRLSRLAPRAARAGVTVAETRLLDPEREAAALADLKGAADLVVIDAPCSGTGTWRRNPEARWRLTPERIDRVCALQARLLAVGAALVRPGGALAYIVCSLLDEEGPEPVAAWLAANPGWRVEAIPAPAGRAHGPGLRLTPAHDGTDGFFVARLIRPC